MRPANLWLSRCSVCSCESSPLLVREVWPLCPPSQGPDLSSVHPTCTAPLMRTQLPHKILITLIRGCERVMNEDSVSAVQWSKQWRQSRHSWGGACLPNYHAIMWEHFGQSQSSITGPLCYIPAETSHLTSLLLTGHVTFTYCWSAVRF